VALPQALAGLAADLGSSPDHTAAVAQWWTDAVAAVAGTGKLPKLPETA
jgi:hypothetical protein